MKSLSLRLETQTQKQLPRHTTPSGITLSSMLLSTTEPNYPPLLQVSCQCQEPTERKLKRQQWLTAELRSVGKATTQDQTQPPGAFLKVAIISLVSRSPHNLNKVTIHHFQRTHPLHCNLQSYGSWHLRTFIFKTF